MSESIAALESISSKLDTLIAIARLVNKEKIEENSLKIKKDSVYAQILQVTVEPVSYGDLSKRVAETTGTAEITVKRKVAELRDLGAICVRRKGRDAFYENTGLLD